MNKSITICYCLRNDNYQKKLIEKFIFSLNFNLLNIKKLSLLNRFKILKIDLFSLTSIILLVMNKKLGNQHEKIGVP